MLKFIDGGGRPLRATMSLQKAFGTQLQISEFASFMVRNMGWAALRSHQAKYEAQVRPDSINDSTLLTLIYDIRSARQTSVQLKVFNGCWSTVDFSDAADAVTYLSRLVENARFDLRKGDFLRSSLRRSQAPAAGSERLLLDAWGSGERRADRLAVLAERLFGGRYVIAGRDEAGATCVLAGGSDFNLIGQQWMYRVQQLRLTDWPDAAYGRWMEEAYREVWRSGEPLLDDVDSFIDWPKLGRRQHKYRRVVLPCQSVSGIPLLVAAMRNDASIDLRAKLH